MSDLDDRYATFREHAELRERTASLEVTVSNLPTQLARIETAILAQKQAAAPDHVVLALQRAADVFERGKSSGGGSIVTVFAIIGAIAMGALAALLLT